MSAAPPPVSKPLDDARDEHRAYALDDALDFSGRDADYFVVPRDVLEHWRASRRDGGAQS